MCESGSHLVVSWDPKSDGPPSLQPFRCRSWRHTGECQRWKGSQDFVRCRDAMLAKGDHWVYIVLTFDQKQFNNEWSAYRGGVHRWQKLNQRLSYHYGRVDYLQTWEKHTKTDFPHVNVAVHNARIWQTCRGDGWKQFRQLLTQHAVKCGFGFRVWVEPLREGQGLTLAGYFTKLSRELTGAGVKNQVPVNAPPHFRRIRASRGLLPAQFHSEGRTGALIPSRLVDQFDFSAEGRLTFQKSRKSKPRAKLGVSGV
jgi:hypothetical protein